jgi:hypothetical protein
MYGECHKFFCHQVTNLPAGRRGHQIALIEQIKLEKFSVFSHKSEQAVLPPAHLRRKNQQSGFVAKSEKQAIDS